jgi:hypothetical protein
VVFNDRRTSFFNENREEAMSNFPSQEVLVAAVNQILDKAGGEKLTLRQIFYKLVVMKLFENTIGNYKLLSARLVIARECGDVDDRRIEDRARTISGGDCSFRNPEEYYQDHENAFRRCWSQYTRPFWLDQPRYVEVWIEKDSLSRIAIDAASRFNVTVCVGRGYSSYSYINEAVKRIIRNCGTDEDDQGLILKRHPVILYFGDHDPSGSDMVRDLESRLRRYGLDVTEKDYQIVHKIAITEKQIKELNLPTIPISKKKQEDDSRAKKFIKEFGKDTVELDTLDTALLKSLIRSSIEMCINGPIWESHQEASEGERNAMRTRIEEHFRRSGQ